ncbi:hypothetical protein [Gordonia alkanivorans]|uniref:hypothetical protein n=1 Tax=Gordonia alkanivorans TaxID=84096 RepID=UPI00244C58CD|nr:hypothetical protein [Gordonia alkanivorans]MDH3047269.1 hypothetical protein [Gordonia alkanivorans]
MVKTGARLQSQVDDTQVIIIKATSETSELYCGGHPMVDVSTAATEPLDIADGRDTGTAIGKRYVDEGDSVEVLVTKPGRGTLSLGEAVLTIKDAKPLPASD